MIVVASVAAVDNVDDNNVRIGGFLKAESKRATANKIKKKNKSKTNKIKLKLKPVAATTG